MTIQALVSGVAGVLQGERVVKRFEDELKSSYQVRYCFAVSSGKAALALILGALHEIRPERDEVLIPAYTCYSVPSAIKKAGLKIRLCDMAPEKLDFDFNRIANELENPRLLCVIPTHLFGIPADVGRVKTLIGRRDIFVIEDAAQAMGGEWESKRLGTQGDAGLFSLGRGKAFSAVEGGIILTDSDQIGRLLEKRVTAIKGYGGIDTLKLLFNAAALSVLVNPWLYWLPNSLPFLKLGETHFDPEFSIRRLSSFQAGMAKKWQSTTIQHQAFRRTNSALFADCGLPLPRGRRGKIPDLIRYPVLAADGDSKKNLLKKSARMGLGISGCYPDSVAGVSELRDSFEGSTFPVAKDIADRMVSLPVHPYVNGTDVTKIIQLFTQERAYAEKRQD